MFSLSIINFKGKLASQAEIKQLCNNDTYTNVPASLVELDIGSTDDFEALGKVVYSWRDRDIYAVDVYNRFKKFYMDNEQPNDERFFVLTKQTKNLEKLDSTRILGVAELYKPMDETIEIEFLQTDPTYVYSLETPLFKHIGKAIIESFKKILKEKEIVLFTTPTAKKFYEKLGFKNIKSNLMILRR